MALSGLIGVSGKFYPCMISGHSAEAMKHKDDAPFAIIRTHLGDCNNSKNRVIQELSFAE